MGDEQAAFNISKMTKLPKDNDDQCYFVDILHDSSAMVAKNIISKKPLMITHDFFLFVMMIMNTMMRT